MGSPEPYQIDLIRLAVSPVYPLSCHTSYGGLPAAKYRIRNRAGAFEEWCKLSWFLEVVGGCKTNIPSSSTRCVRQSFGHIQTRVSFQNHACTQEQIKSEWPLRELLAFPPCDLPYCPTNCYIRKTRASWPGQIASNDIHASGFGCERRVQAFRLNSFLRFPNKIDLPGFSAVSSCTSPYLKLLLHCHDSRPYTSR